MGYRVDWRVGFVVVLSISGCTVGAIQQSAVSAKRYVVEERGRYPVA